MDSQKGRTIYLKYERQQDGILWKELKLIENESFSDSKTPAGVVSIFLKEGGHGQPHIKFGPDLEMEVEGLRQLVAWSVKGRRPGVVEVNYRDEVETGEGGL